MASRKARIFWPVLAAIILTDCSTKQLVVEQLAQDPGPHPIIGDWFRLTLAYNPYAALSLSFGSAAASRILFSAAAITALMILLRLYHTTDPGGRLRAAAIALVAGGAFGNLLDRIRSARGVVDFIDVGVGDARFYTFNVADVGVTVGAVLLAIVLWREDRFVREDRA